jgi:hypothetical protein
MPPIRRLSLPGARARGLFAVLLAALVAVGYATPSRVVAQTASASPTPGSTSRPDALWQCTLPGGVYLVALRSIASISTHEYIVDGAARVTEVTVATNSSVEARFYYLEPVTPSSASTLVPTSALTVLTQHAQDTVNSQASSESVWQKVVKTYPTTTHAHTVEYRLESKDNLQALYSSLQQSWTTGKGVNFTTQ